MDLEEIKDSADHSEGRIYSKKLLLQTQDEIATLNREMNQAVVLAAERILDGEAKKTPSKDACLFCPVRGYCDKAYHE